MKKDHLYLFTLTGLTLIVITICGVSGHYLFSVSKNRYLKVQLESSKREAREVARLLERQLEDGESKEKVARNLQASIENTDMQAGFICMYNTSGIEICHPDPRRIGQVITFNNSEVDVMKNAQLVNFRSMLQTGRQDGGRRSFTAVERDSEIIYVYPVQKTDWMVAAHANIAIVEKQLNNLAVNFILIHALSAMIIILLSFVVVRWVGSKYEKKIESEKDELMEDVKALSMLNADLTSHKRKIEELHTRPEDACECNQKRILTYYRDQLVPVQVTDVAFFHTRHSLTYIHCLDGQVFNSNNSLDDILSQLNKAEFFRANRQFIISIRSIDKIYRFGNNQLKIAIEPEAPEQILISKNKVAEFKTWLNS